MTDQVRRGAEVLGHFGHPGAHPVDGGHGWPVGLSVPREVHRRGPVAVVGQEPGLLRPHRSVHAGAVDE